MNNTDGYKFLITKLIDENRGDYVEGEEYPSWVHCI